MTIAQDKADLRASARRVRQEAHATLGAAPANAVAARGREFLSSATLPGAPIVAVYAAIGTELDSGPLLHSLVDQDVMVALPVTVGQGRPLVFRAWKPGDELSSGFLGIQEPLPTAEKVQPDVLFVPLLAFDEAGFRLGYGGGYYDRSLAELRALKSVIAIGVAFDEQKVDVVPRCRYDQQLDWMLTPQAMRRCHGI